MTTPNPLAVPKPTPDQTEQWFQTVTRYVVNKRPCYLPDGTYNDPSGKLAINQADIKYVLLVKGVTPMLVGDYVVNWLSLPPTQTPGGLSYDAAWEKVNSSHGALGIDLKRHFASGTEWKSPGTAADGSPLPAAPDVPNVPVLDATDVASEIYQRTFNEPPVYANGFEVCNQADWFRTWKPVAQQSFSKILGDEWAGVPLETRRVAAYYLWFDVNAPGPRENPTDADHPFYGPLTAAELAGLDPAQAVAHVGKGNGLPSGNVP